MARGRRGTPADFWARVDRRGPDECWLWTGPFHSAGYGKLGYQGKDWNAHKLAWVLTNGPVVGELCVCHRCDNPPCCNPGHMFLGSRAENRQDCVAKGRHAQGDGTSARLYPELVPRGEGHGRAVLTEVQVIEIRARRREGATIDALAAHYGIGRSQVFRIGRREAWKHVA